MAIETKITSVIQNNSDTEIGIEASNVYIALPKNNPNDPVEYITLQNWIDNFNDNAKFIQYGTETPSSNSVKFWYDTNPNTNS